jgi:HSP20 family protein
MVDLTRWEPFREMEKLPEQMARFFSFPTFGFPALRPSEEALTVADFIPPVDIYETDREYLVKLDLPEVSREEVKVFVEDGVLTIQGERKKEKEEKGKRFHRIERSYGTFLRTFTVPSDADDTKIDAEFKEGLLKVHLPKSEKAKPKTIDVKVS